MFEASAVAAPLREELAQLRVDGRDRSATGLATLVEHCQSVVNQAIAVQTLAMAHLAAIEDVELEDGTVVEQHRGLGHQRLDAPALVSEQLGLSDGAASGRMSVAVEVVTRVPVLLEAMASGRLDGYRAAIVCEELRDAPPEVCREVGARIESSLGSEPAAVLRRRVRRALGAVDADLLRAKAARARATRSLRRWPGDEPGVDTWMGSFPVEQARTGWAVIDGLARQYVRDCRARGVDEARADALMDLIHSRATGQFVVQLAVPADRLAARAHRLAAAADRLAAPAEHLEANVPAEADEDALVTVTGFGMPGDAQVRRAWLRGLTDGTGGTAGTGRISAADAPVVACHADTGALLAIETPAHPRRARATESQSYRPPPALVELVKARDGHCRFPGCTVSAVFCDLDHVRPWPSGPTRATNLMCLCRRHHRIKQSVRWRVRIEPDASVTWTDPIGRTRTTLPPDFLQLEHDEQAAHHERRTHHNERVEHPRPPGTQARRPERPPPEPGWSAPGDEVGVLWSAWEDELTHHLARADRDRGRQGRSRRGANRHPWEGLSVRRPPTDRPDRQSPAAERNEATRGTAAESGANAPPPF